MVIGLLSAQIGSIALGLAISGAVFVNSTQSVLTDILSDVPQSESLQIVSGSSSELFNTLPTALRELTLSAVISSLPKVYFRSLT